MSYARQQAIEMIANALWRNDSARAMKANFSGNDLLKVRIEQAPMADYMVRAQEMLDAEKELMAQERIMNKIGGS